MADVAKAAGYETLDEGCTAGTRWMCNTESATALTDRIEVRVRALESGVIGEVAARGWYLFSP